MRKGRQNKQRMTSEERRESILEAALKLFAEKGFSGVRTREIAKEARISETLVFQHFRSKHELYTAALKHLFSEHPVEIDLEKSIDARDDKAVFRNLALHILHHSEEDPRVIRMSIFCALEGPGFLKEIQKTESALLNCAEPLVKYIEARIAEGAFRKMNALITAYLFLDMVFMHSADKQVPITGAPLPYSDEEVVEQMVEIFMNGIQA